MNINDVALRHLSSRSRTVHEMREHLGKKGFEKKEIEELIEELSGYGYLDDFKYCLEYFDYAFGKGKGRLRVINEVKQKGVAASTAEAAMEEYTPKQDELNRARSEAARVMADAGFEEDSDVSDKILGRTARKLEAKGYRPDIIYKIIGELRG